MKNIALGALAALSLIVAPISAFAGDTKFDIINHSARGITNFYTSPADATNWEEDVLGEDVIGPGETQSIKISVANGQCLYDMRFILEDKTDLIEKGINVCTLSDYTLSDSK